MNAITRETLAKVEAQAEVLAQRYGIQPNLAKIILIDGVKIGMDAMVKVDQQVGLTK